MFLKFITALFSLFMLAAFFCCADLHVFLLHERYYRSRKYLKSQPTSANRFFSEDGVLIAEEYDVHRIYVTDMNVPQYLKPVFISAEDKSFTITRFDFKSIAGQRHRIFITMCFCAIIRLIGASTITQQLIKNLLNDNERTLHES